MQWETMVIQREFVLVNASAVGPVLILHGCRRQVCVQWYVQAHKDTLVDSKYLG
jgi:hypothetical protein